VKILHISQPTTAGTAVVLRTLVADGVRRGHEVTVACPSGGDLSGWVQSAGATWVELPMERAPGRRDLGAVVYARRLLKSCDVVHLHSSKAGAIGRVAAWTLGRRRPPVAFTPHGWSWYVGGRMSRYYRVFERWAAKHCDVVVAVSVEELADGEKVLGHRGTVVAIENGVDTGAFRPGAHQHRADPPLIVTVGRLSEQKGQDRLLRAVAQLRRQDLTVRLVGSGPDELGLRRLAVELGVAERVEFAGERDPREDYRAATLVVLPSRWEGLSLVLLESMACGAPIIASAAGAGAVLGESGVVIDSGSDQAFVDQLAGAVADLLDDEGRRHLLGSAARNRILERYSLERTLDAYDDLWANLAAAREAGAPVLEGRT